MTSKFKNSTGLRLLMGLFYETQGADKSSVVYTLKHEDHMGYPSLYRLYMETGDITEYRFAIAHLDGWEHWKQLCKCKWFQEYVASWREELEVRLASQNMDRIINTARSSDQNAYAASKWLLERAEKVTGKSKAGRPTKVAIQNEINQRASLAVLEASEYERVLGGGKTN